MSSLQEAYDEALLDFSRAEYDRAIGKLRTVLAADPDHFDARLALGMALYRQGNYAAAIEEGHKAEQMRPKEQLVHTNLSLFYMKAGNKLAAEHHGLQARIAGWREDNAVATPGSPQTSELDLAKPKPQAMKFEGKFPDMPWKKKPAPGG